MEGTRVIDCEKIHATTEVSGKAAITKVMKEKGYFPASVSDGKWHYSKHNPNWVLRNKWRRLFVRVRAGNNGSTHYLSAILVPQYHRDLDAIMKTETEH